jgi:paraquat-inducible protein A
MQTEDTWSTALASRATGWDRLITLGLLGACVLLVAGLTLPIIKTSRLWIFSDELSLVGVVRVLWIEHEFLLSIVVLVFSLVFPAAKLLIAYALWRFAAVRAPRFDRLLALVEFLGKWSLADVLIVALAIVVIKSSGLMDATIGLGVYPFGASIVLTAAIVARVKQLARRDAAREGDAAYVR